MAVTISYKNSKISEINDNDVKKLETAGKYCESNIIINYNKEGNKIVEGNSSITITDAEEGDICALTQYGACEQDPSTNAISCNNGVLSISSGEIITTGTNETVTVGSQTATIENLYSVGNIKDEQEIVTGRVTRKNDICIYDSTQLVGDRYISSTGAKDNGAIIIYPREEEYNSEDIVSFSKNTEEDINSLEVNMSPIQSLNGYSKPWPAGGGKNLWDTKPYKGLSYNIAVGTTVSLTDGAAVDINGNEISYSISGWGYRNFKTKSLTAGTYKVYFDISEITSPAISVYNVGSDNVIKKVDNYRTSAGSTVNTNRTIADGDYIVVYISSETAQTIKITDYQIEAGSSHTDWEPFENICPISGRTGLSAYRTGFNLCADSVHLNYFWDDSGILQTNKNGNYAAIGTKVPVAPNEDYCVYLPDNASGGRIYVQFFNASKSLITQENYTIGSFNIFTTTADTRFITISFYKSGGVSVGERICVNLSDANNGTYEPYNGSTYSVDWEYQFNVNDATDIESGTNKKLSVSDGLLTVTATGAVSTTSIVTTDAFSTVIENATLPAGIYSFSVSDFSATVTGAILDSIKLTITTNGVDTAYSRNTPIVLTNESTIKNIAASTTLQWNTGNTLQFRITIDSAVYDGKLDVVSGQLTVNWCRIGLGSISWSVNGERFDSAYLDSASMVLGKTTVQCEIYKSIPNMSGAGFNSSAPNYQICFNSSAGRPYLMVKDPRYLTGSDLKTALNGVYAIYELATPLTYQLTPQEVKTLVGKNNIFSPDATSIKVAVSNPRIEQVTPQPLTLIEGTNTVAATNLNVSSVPLKLEYNKKNQYQNKTITSSTVQQIVTADSGYDALSQVIVNPSAATLLKVGVIRPDAELVKTWSHDSLFVTDDQGTIPAYTTTATTLTAAASLGTTYTVDLTNYDYFVLIRGLTIPVYNTSTPAKGRNEYAVMSAAYELVNYPASTFTSLVGNKTYASNFPLVTTAYAAYCLLYWSTASAVKLYNATSYGVAQTVAAPSISGSTLTVQSPALKIRGSTTYLTSAVWGTMTDIRWQYIIELYRAPKSNMNLDGWGLVQQGLHVVDCAESNTHKLT